MKLRSEEAKEIVESYRGKTLNDKWIDHCICVGDTAGKIAKALEEKGYNIDVDKAIAIGYVHDIGAYTNTQYHVKETYKLKDYFDNLLGYNLYDLFPEIKDNL